MSEVDGLMSVVCSRLLDTCCCGGVRTLVDGRLHLLQELINVHEIVLGSKIWHWWECILMLGHWTTVTSVAINRNHGWAGWHVIRNSSTMDWDSLQSHQSLSDLSIRRRVNLTALCITEEVVQGIVTALSVVVRGMLAEITAMAHRVIDWTIRGWLLRCVIAVVTGVVRIAIISRRARVHLGAMAIIVRASSCKVLQVSNYCVKSQM